MPDPTPSYTIIQVVEVTEELVKAARRLIPQLTRINPPPTSAELVRMLSEGTSILFIAKDQHPGEEMIIGLATLVLYRVPTGLRAIIEDLVVDEKTRGRGIGEALTRTCLEWAARAGCPQVVLTSNPAREAANRLYQRMGFELRKTNMYRYRFSKG